MISIIKIPFDACIVEKERRGAAKGPEAIEAELKNFFKFDELKVKPEFVEIKEKNDFDKMHKEVEKKADEEYKNKSFVIGLGGDHSVSYGLMKAFAKNHKNAGLIYFDAHLDCQDDFLPPTHEDVLRAAVKEKLFKKIFVYGIRNYTEKEKKFAMENFSWDSAEVPIKSAEKHIFEELLKEVDSIYISIDIDAIDPAFAPGTGWPEPLGMLPQDFINLLRKIIATKKVKGIDIVEVSPPKDVNNMTAKLAARLLLEFLNSKA
jgi:agmatinase